MRRQAGFTYVGALIAVALAGIALAGAGLVWSTEAARERERELLFVGDQFRRAIASYAAATPPGSKRFPESLDQLVEDKRWPVPKRHLRRLYRDPMTGAADWAVVRNADGGIVGVHSTATRPALKRANFPPLYAEFADRTTVAGWVFRHVDSPGGGGADSPATAAAPDEPVPPLAEPPAPPAPSLREDLTTRSTEACQRINAADLATCAEVALLIGPAAAAVCRQSAAARAAACASPPAPLPGLFFPREHETGPGAPRLMTSS